jgi:DtxR family Mn-dependent transcriptional regulator
MGAGRPAVTEPATSAGNKRPPRRRAGRPRAPVIAARLAHEVRVSAPAVAEAIGRLVRAGYVRVGRGRRLRLTARGREVATALIRRRQRWLTHLLGLDVVAAQEEAHRLEHAVSPQVEHRLAQLLVRAR